MVWCKTFENLECLKASSVREKIFETERRLTQQSFDDDREIRYECLELVLNEVVAQVVEEFLCLSRKSCSNAGELDGQNIG